MIPIPAIDLKDGRCVRLRQGRAEDATVYADDPVAMARHWCDEGALALHVVDLDGAFAGHPVHTDLILRLAAAVDVPVQVGGGLRSRDDVACLVDGGLARVIFGTRALEAPEGIGALAQEFGNRIAVGIDARGGRVQVRGWVETTAVEAVALAARVAQFGIRMIIYTDTATDGMLTGINATEMDRICRCVPEVNVIASGGVASAADIRRLMALGHENLIGAIVGKALYEGCVTVAELNASCKVP